MSRSSGRGQTEPLAALAAVVAVSLGLSLYVGVLDASIPERTDRSVAETAVDRVERAVAPDGVAEPGRLEAGREAGPAGYATNVTLAVDDRAWTAGPAADAAGDVATRRVAVRTRAGSVRRGTLRVAVRR